MCACWPVPSFFQFPPAIRVQKGCKQEGKSAPGSQRHERTGQLCPFQPGPGPEGEAIKLAFANKQHKGDGAQERPTRFSVSRCGNES